MKVSKPIFATFSGIYRRSCKEYKEFRSSGVQEFRSSGVQEFRRQGVQEFRSSGVQELPMGNKTRFSSKYGLMSTTNCGIRILIGRGRARAPELPQLLHS